MLHLDVTAFCIRNNGAYQTDGSGTILATFIYDTSSTLTSVTVGSGPGAPRYHYVYDGHGDVVAVTDSSGNVVASYAYDTFGALTSSSESFPNGWSNPYRYDGAEGVRYDTETGLYWMSVRAYDPTLGRFISHDPLGRLASQGIDTLPYVYVANNPINRMDPSDLFGGRPLVDGGEAANVASVAAQVGKTIATTVSGGSAKNAHRTAGSGSISHGSGSSGKGGRTTPQGICCDDPTPTPTQNPSPTPPSCTTSPSFCDYPTPSPTPTPTQPTPTPTSGSGDTCSRHSDYDWHWWGLSLYLNHCILNDFSSNAALWWETPLLTGIAFAGKASGIAMDLILAKNMGWLADADTHHCGGNGAWLNIPWAGSVVGAWVSCSNGGSPAWPWS